MCIKLSVLIEIDIRKASLKSIDIKMVKDKDETGNKIGRQKKVLRSKPTPLSKGKKVPCTVFGALDDASVIKKTEKKTNKKFKLGDFKPSPPKGTKTPYGFKPLDCKPAVMYATPKYLCDNTRSQAEKYKPQGFPTEKFLSFPRNDFVI